MLLWLGVVSEKAIITGFLFKRFNLNFLELEISICKVLRSPLVLYLLRLFFNPFDHLENEDFPLGELFFGG